jgi:hypothetical protein
MLDIHEIDKEIKCLEECGCTTYDVCRKLAILYLVKDHYKGGNGYENSESPSMSSTSINKVI